MPENEETNWKPDLDIDGIEEPDNVEDQGDIEFVEPEEDPPLRRYDENPRIESEQLEPASTQTQRRAGVVLVAALAFLIMLGVVVSVFVGNSNTSTRKIDRPFVVKPETTVPAESRPWEKVYEAAGAPVTGDDIPDAVALIVWAEPVTEANDIEFLLKTFVVEMRMDDIEAKYLNLIKGSEKFYLLPKELYMTETPYIILAARNGGATTCTGEITVETLKNTYNEIREQ